MQIIDTIMDWERFEDEIESHTASLIKAQVRLPVSLPLPPPPGSTEESKLDNSEMISRKRLDNSVAEFGASVSSRVMERDMNEMMNMIREQNQRIKVLERTLDTYGNAIESSTSLSMATIESMDKKIVRIGDSMSKVNQNHARHPCGQVFGGVLQPVGSVRRGPIPDSRTRSPSYFSWSQAYYPAPGLWMPIGSNPCRPTATQRRTQRPHQQQSIPRRLSASTALRNSNDRTIAQISRSLY